jgi:ABC-type transporter Mla MlaB component
VAEPLEHSTDLASDPSSIPGPRTAVVVVDGPLSPGRIAALCIGVRRQLATRRVDVVVYDVGAVVEPDVMIIEALARLQLTARRTGGSIGVRHASGRLRDLLDLVGLCDVIALCDESPLESCGQVEEEEQVLVEERVERGDPTG